MTERSYVWDGIVTGDSTLAPYYAEAFNQYMHMSVDGQTDLVYVFPDYLNNLDLLYSINSPYSLTLKPGAAVFKNFLYVQSENQSFNLDSAAAGYYRLDTLVLQINYADQTVRPVVLSGTLQTSITNAITYRATLTQIDDFLWEQPLYYVLVDGDEVDNVTSDMRQFVVSFETVLKPCPVLNSEFLAFSPGIASDGPEEWDNSDGTALAAGTIDTLQGRGQTIQLTQDQGIRQDFPVNKGSGKTFSAFCLIGGSTHIRLRGLLPTLSYTDWYTSWANDSLADYAHITHTFDEEIIEVQLEIINLFGGSIYVGQALFIEGYHTGHNQFIIDQLITLNHRETDAGWSATASSTGTTTVNLTASFGGNFKSGTKAIVLRLEANDSASAAGGGIYLRGASLKTEGDVLLDAVPNDYKRSLEMLVPISYEIFNTSSGVPQFDIEVSSSGANTLDATARIAGIIT